MSCQFHLQWDCGVVSLTSQLERWSAALILGALIPMSQPLPVHLDASSLCILHWSCLVSRWHILAFGIRCWVAFRRGVPCLWSVLGVRGVVRCFTFRLVDPISFFGLSLGLGLFTGIMALVARLFWRPGISRISCSCRHVDAVRRFARYSFHRSREPGWECLGGIWIPFFK